MSFTVSKSPAVMVVAPSSSTTTEKMKLSSWDLSVGGSPITAFLVFDGGAIQSPAAAAADAIREGLAQALVHYYPVAGRLATGGGGDDDGDGEVHIACTGEGVPFVAASADCTLDDSRLLDVPLARNLLDDLAVHYAAEGCRAADPLLLMQVTEFSCGGFVVGATWNHVLADGEGMAQFLQAVGELTRGMAAPSVVPVRGGGGGGGGGVSLPVMSPTMVAAKQWLLLCRGGTGFAYLDITVPRALIHRVKSDFAAAHSAGTGDGEHCHCTTFEAVTAVVWQCRTRAIGLDPDTTAMLAFVVNVRKHVGAEAAGYYGNCMVGQVAMATSRDVVGGDIVDLVKLIKRAKESVPELLVDDTREEDVGGGGMGIDEAKEELASLFGYNAFMVSSWRNIGFDAVDFGSGGSTPARVMSWWQQATTGGCIALLPCRRSMVDGEIVQTQFVKEEHAAAFLAQLADLSSA